MGLAFDRKMDEWLTSRIFGFPLMLFILATVFWITIEGANIPSSLLATALIDNGHSALKALSLGIGIPWWLDGLLLDGVYLATAWVVAVMLPPMAIFSHSLPCLKISVICLVWRSISIRSFVKLEHMASKL